MRPVQEVDAVWRALKPWGRYQIVQLLITILDFFPACFAILSAVFTGKFFIYKNCVRPCVSYIMSYHAVFLYNLN